MSANGEHSGSRHVSFRERGDLSIILQGGVFKGNIVQIATHCRHWRDLFPNAEIILSISSPDILVVSRLAGVGGLSLTATARVDGALVTAMKVIRETCDKVVQAKAALPLPPIKTNAPGMNNVNLMLAAAHAGLAVARGKYTLRVRNDLIFSNDTFLQQWVDGVDIARGDRAALSQRLLISPLYTLNPYTFERLPFHYSDWFHFGLTKDVAAFWDVPPMSLADSVHYKTQPFAPYSNYDELRNTTRLAVEQHLSFSFISRIFPDLKLDYHNDLTSRRESIDVLCDNFVICDLVSALCIFDKYSVDFDNPTKAVHCINARDWRHIARSGAVGRDAYLREKQHAAERPATVKFPRTFSATNLLTKVGDRGHRNIIATRKNGVLLHGPYDDLPEGHYTAVICLAGDQPRMGSVEVRLTLNEGAEVLLVEKIDLDGHTGNISLDFEVTAQTATAFEVVVLIEHVRNIVISGIEVHRRSGGTHRISEFASASAPMASLVGKIAAGRLCTTGVAGVLMYGPYITLGPGRYDLSVEIPEMRTPGAATLEVVNTVRPSGQIVQIATWPLVLTSPDTGGICLTFEVEDTAQRAEFRIHVDAQSDFSVGNVHVTRA